MRHELRELGVDTQGGGSGGVDGGYLVEEVGQPHEVCAVAEVEAPHGVVDGLVAYVDFLGHAALAEMHHRRPQREVLVEAVLRVEAEQGLALHGEHGLVLERDADGGAGLDDALVGDGDDAHVVVDGVVGILRELHSARGDDH